jgi:Zn-dependent protease with chaperone function
MKKSHLLLLCLLLAHFTFIFSQQVDFNNYQILQSSGKLPLELSDMLNEDLKNTDNSDKSKRSKKDERDFIYKSTYSLNKLLRSGAVIYNDPVGEYLTKVLQTVLDANGIDNDITVYFVRSEEVNAYATDKNFIFVTAGLMAQVTTEAQLAMILSHEYIHFKNKHNRTEYIGNKAIARDYRDYKTSSTDAKLLIASFSRELETEADLEGFKLFTNSTYTYNGVVEAFEVLKYSYLPFEELTYNKSFLETNDLIFPDNYFLSELAAINPTEHNKNKEDELYRSHPDIDKRIVKMQELTEGKDNATRKEFLISEANFFEFRKIARFELCRLYLLEKRYEDAFYSAYILLKEEPASIFLKKIVLKSLYGLTKFNNANKFSEVHISHNKKQGESQQVNYLFHSLTKNEVNLTSLNYAWRLHQTAPNDIEITTILEELAYDACKYNKLTPYSLKTEPRDTSVGIANDSITVIDTTTRKNNKYLIVKRDSENLNNTKIKKKAATFIDYAFVSLFQDQAFKDLLKDQYKKWDDDEKEKERLATLKTRKTKSKFQDDQIDENRNITDMIVLNPVILKLDMRSNVNKLYQASSAKRNEMMSNFVMLSDKNGIKSTMMNPAEITENDPELLNDMSLLNIAMTEVLTLPSKINMLPTDHLDLKKIADKYNTPYLANIGVLTFVEPRRGVLGAVLVGVVTMGFLLPYTIYVLAKPNATTLVYMSVYNIESNKFVFSDVSELKSGGSQDLMGSVLYDMVLRMKKNK